MKFVNVATLAMLATSASASESTETIGLNSQMQLVSQALEMGGSRQAASELIKNALKTFDGDAAAALDSHSQLVSVPIDEKLALTVKVSPTEALDSINSVTLKAFRKIVGYDTFDSIRRKDRSETKDTSDYYNVTVSMMVQRKPVEGAAAATPASTLASTLDKGFPYDE